MMSPVEQEHPHGSSEDRWSHVEWDDEEEVLRLRNRQACQDRMTSRLMRSDRSAAWLRSGGRKRFSVRDRAPREGQEQLGA